MKGGSLANLHLMVISLRFRLGLSLFISSFPYLTKKKRREKEKRKKSFLLLSSLSLLGQVLPLLTLFLSLLLLLDLLQGVNTLSKAVRGVEVVRDLLTTDQAQDDAAADDEGQDEAVHGVPGWSVALDGGAGVGVVEVGEGEELTDQSVFDGEEEGGPCYGWCDYADGVAAVAGSAAVFGPFETPVDGAEE